MITNFGKGEILKGSDCEIAVVFSTCKQHIDIGQAENFTCDIYTTPGGAAITRSLDDFEIDGEVGITLLQWEELDQLEDGVLRYTLNFDYEGEHIVREMSTMYYLKTPIDYTPTDFVDRQEMEGYVQGAISGFTTGETRVLVLHSTGESFWEGSVMDEVNSAVTMGIESLNGEYPMILFAKVSGTTYPFIPAGTHSGFVYFTNVTPAYYFLGQAGDVTTRVILFKENRYPTINDYGEGKSDANARHTVWSFYSYSMQINANGEFIEDGSSGQPSGKIPYFYKCLASIKSNNNQFDSISATPTILMPLPIYYVDSGTGEGCFGRVEWARETEEPDLDLDHDGEVIFAFTISLGGENNLWRFKCKVTYHNPVWTVLSQERVVINPISSAETQQMIDDAMAAIPAYSGASEQYVQSAITEATSGLVSEGTMQAYVDAMVPDMEGYATEQWVSEQGFLISEDVQDFITSADTRDFLTSADTQAFITSADTQDFLTSADTQDFLTSADTADFITSADTSNFAIALTSVNKIWGGSAQAYSALTSYDNDTIYFVEPE